MMQEIQSGDLPSRQEGSVPGLNERRWRAREKLSGLFFSCPIRVPGEILSAEWSRKYLRLFAEGNPELLSWARQNELPSSLWNLPGRVNGEAPQYISIFEQLRELRPEVAFRPEHLSQYRLSKLRNPSSAGFVGPYGMPTIGTVLPLVAGLIVASRWPEFLDKPQPERKQEDDSWRRARRRGLREARAWHW